MATKKQTARIRKKCKGKQCVYCGDRWTKARSNYFQEKSSTCLFCHQRINSYTAHGAAWCMAREDTLAMWARRLTAVTGGRRKLRKVS